VSRRWQAALITVLAACCCGLLWAGLTVHRLWLGLFFLALACVLWVPMALLVPARPDPDE
jgi:hypothetical protein